MKLSCNKKTFDTKQDAAIRRNEINKEEGTNKMNSYFCQICKGYHLTSKSKNQYRKRKEFLIQETEYWNRKLKIKQEI